MWSLLLTKHIYYMLLFKSCRLWWWPIPLPNGGPLSFIKSTHDPSSNVVWTSNSPIGGYICLTNYPNSHYHQHNTSRIGCSIGLWPKALINASAKREYFVKNNEHIVLIDCTEFLVWCRYRDLVSRNLTLLLVEWETTPRVTLRQNHQGPPEIIQVEYVPQ